MSTLDVAAYHLRDVELLAVNSLIAELDSTNHDPGTPQFYDGAWWIAPRLPPRLRAFLADFRLHESSSACRITGFPVDDVLLGSTPADLSHARAIAAGRREEYFIGLIALCLGEVFNWSTLQGGRLIHDVMPIRGQENAQSGHGSDAILEWHVEDAFHPYRADYLLLMGLRNRDHVPTTLSSVRQVAISPEYADILSEPRFHILPDNEHINQLAAVDSAHPGLLRMRGLRDSPPAVSVLFGDPAAPYVRIDPIYMRAKDHDDRAQAALTDLARRLDAVKHDLIIGPGDVLVVDNYLAVHGRRSFTARYDGTDRWLKKLLVTRDLRKSRAWRDTPAGRVVT